VKVIGWVSYDRLLIMGVFLCWVVEGLFAMPVFVTLRRLNRVNLKTSVVTGLLIGTAFGLISNFSIDLYWRDPHRTLHYLVQVMDTAFLGGSIGFFFWLIGVWRNPAFMKQSDIRVEDVFT